MTALSPQEIKTRLTGSQDLDPALDFRMDAETYRLYRVIDGCSWDQPFAAGYGDLAKAMERSPRAIMRSVQVLEELKYIKVLRKHNKNNQYMTELTGKRGESKPEVKPEQPPVTAKKRKRTVKLATCVTPGCLKSRPATRLDGLCRSCRRDAHTEKIARKVVKQAMQA